MTKSKQIYKFVSTDTRNLPDVMHEIIYSGINDHHTIVPSKEYQDLKKGNRHQRRAKTIIFNKKYGTNL